MHTSADSAGARGAVRRPRANGLPIGDSGESNSSKVDDAKCVSTVCKFWFRCRYLGLMLRLRCVLRLSFILQASWTIFMIPCSLVCPVVSGCLSKSRLQRQSTAVDGFRIQLPSMQNQDLGATVGVRYLFPATGEHHEPSMWNAVSNIPCEGLRRSIRSSCPLCVMGIHAPQEIRIAIRPLFAINDNASRYEVARSWSVIDFNS